MPLNRRESMPLPPLPLGAEPLAVLADEDDGMFVCMHEIASITFDFRTAMEGYARAAAVEDLKWKVELAEVIGADRMVIPSAAIKSLVI